MLFPDETFHSASSDLRELPPVELSTLPLILKVLPFSFFVHLLCYKKFWTSISYNISELLVRLVF